MYSVLLVLHSGLRWFVLAFLLYAIYRAYIGLANAKPFSKTDNLVRHVTATIAHVQLVIGVLIYVKSPLTHYLWGGFADALTNGDAVFFGLVHALLMLAAIVLITIGSAAAKRKTTDRAKYKTMLVWFCIALIVILVSIPWPFSPLAGRPYLRMF
jgi:hypothetical protein